jgi:hypothetical protein
LLRGSKHFEPRLPSLQLLPRPNVRPTEPEAPNSLSVVLQHMNLFLMLLPMIFPRESIISRSFAMKKSARIGFTSRMHFLVALQLIQPFVGSRAANEITVESFVQSDTVRMR